MEEINNVASFSIFSIFENLNKLDFNLDDFEHNSELKDLSERLGTTIIEAMFFSLIFRLSINDDNDISISDLAVVLKTNNLAVYKHFNILLSLEKNKLIRIERVKSQRDIKICIPQNVFSLIVSGVDSLKREDKGFTFSNVSQQIAEVLASAVKSDYDFVNRMNILRELIIEAREIVEIKWLTEKDLCLEDIVTICTLASMKMKSNDDSISINELLQSLYYSPETILKQRNAFLSGAHKLLQGKLIERHVDDFLVEHSIKLTDFALNNLIGEILTDTTDKKVMAIHSQHLKYNDCEKKKMLFGEDLNSELKRIEKVLGFRNFNEYQKRAQERKVAAGINILLYGYSGTGKTESVKQISRITKRDILMINISDIRQKFIGESEKKISKIFKEYRAISKQLKRTPILLLNEADAILGKRTEVFQSTDQMNNNMQNILLQELEDFEGILMATTNLKKSLDEAFDRRFIIKVKYEKPSSLVQLKILNLKLEKVLTEEQIKLIHSNYCLTGGQMDNLLKNLEMKKVLNEEISNKFINILCKSEEGKQVKQKSAIGFKFSSK